MLFLPAILSQIVPLLIGKAAESVVTDSGPGGLIGKVATKGLIRSKTAKAATVGLGGKIMAAYFLPLPPLWQHGIAAGAVVEWAVNIYLRVKTDSSV